MDTVRERVRELRGRARMSAAELAAELERVGVKWNRSIVANFEGGRRPTLSVVELLALARVLNVSPLNLLVSPDAPRDAAYQVTPEETVSVGDVRRWIAAKGPILGGSREQFFRESWARSFDMSIPEEREKAAAWARAMAEQGYGTVTEGGERGESGEATER
ncbi:hypothetical protein GCM10009535_40320 [Streptomyces thermocarboxydovorans]|uniref:HTH cro/C1-type domain-containing protein n=1 Tax=Streptomyces thermocarboxydovorans TaxID=59298 RepID=A0ABN1HL17_9ACTN